MGAECWEGVYGPPEPCAKLLLSVCRSIPPTSFTGAQSAPTRGVMFQSKPYVETPTLRES